MPQSYKQGKEIPLGWYKTLRPKKVVDIGPGLGTYSLLMRPHHKCKWVGIEVWGPYIAQFDLKKHYDKIIVADVRYLDPKYLRSDIVIIGDVLEHMTKVEAKETIDKIKNQAANAFISVPMIHSKQGPWQGNPFETHVDHWHYEEMEEYLGDGLKASWRGKLGYYWWQRDRQLSTGVSRSPG